MYGMVCSSRARNKQAKTDAVDSDIWPAMSYTLRGLLSVFRACLPSRPRRTAAGAQAADPTYRLRRMRNGKAGPPGYALGSMISYMFQARGYEIVSGCGSGGPEDGPDAKGAKSASYLVYESEGRRTAVLCCVGTVNGSVDWLKECCRRVGAASGVPVSDGMSPAGLEDARREGGPDLEFWDMDSRVSEIRKRLSRGGRGVVAGQPFGAFDLVDH